MSKTKAILITIGVFFVEMTIIGLFMIPDSANVDTGSTVAQICALCLALIISIDAKQIQTYLYKKNSNAFAWAFAVYILQVIALPVYLVKRANILNQTAELKDEYKGMTPSPKTIFSKTRIKTIAKGVGSTVVVIGFLFYFMYSNPTCLNSVDTALSVKGQVAGFQSAFTLVMNDAPEAVSDYIRQYMESISIEALNKGLIKAENAKEIRKNEKIQLCSVDFIATPELNEENIKRILTGNNIPEKLAGVFTKILKNVIATKTDFYIQETNEGYMVKLRSDD